jgi:hypothetical protein
MRPDRTSYDALVEALVTAGCRFHGKGVVCGFHPDHNASGSIKLGADGVWRFKCFACDVAGDVWDLTAKSAGIPVDAWLRENPEADSAPQPKRYSKEKPMRTWPTIEAMAEAKAREAGGTVEKVYVYHDENRQTRMAAVRIALSGDKTFRQGRPIAGGWTDTLPEGMRPLYRLPDLVNAEAVVVVEGEKKADLLWSLGIAATTSANGSKSTKSTDWRPLAGKRVIVWPDHDANGIGYAEDVKRLLLALPNPSEVGVIEPAKLAPAIPHKGDVVDFCKLVGGDEAAQRQAVGAVLLAAAPRGPAQELAASLEAQMSGRVTMVRFPEMPGFSFASRALMPGSVCIVAGQPGATKSFLVLQWLAAWCREGVAAAGLFLEEKKDFWLQRALAQAEANGNLTRPEWCALPENKELVRAAMQRHHDASDRLGRAITCRSDLTLAGVADWVVAQVSAGTRVVIVDPISLAEKGMRESWLADEAFMRKVKPALEDMGASLIATTHPRKGRFTGPPELSDLAGSTVYPRAASVIAWLEPIPISEALTVSTNGEASARINRRIRLLKSRSGPGGTLGYYFDPAKLSFKEAGLLVSAASEYDNEKPKPRRKRYAGPPSAAEDHFAPGGPT